MSDRLDFSLTQLRYFVAAAEEGNISAAAERLHASQSALSSAILRLERQLGCQLFVRRHARGIALTPSGHQLLGEARAMLRQARDLREHSRQLQQEVVGTLDVGCFVTLAPFLIPPVVKKLRDRYPMLSVRTHEADTASLWQLLRDGICELALTYDLGVEEDLTFTELVTIRPYALVAEGHPLAKAGAARLAELAREPFVMLDLPQTHRFMEGMLHRAGVPLPPVISTTSFETMRGLVAAGVGFTILNQRVATPITYHGGRVAPVEIEDDIATVRVGVATMAGIRPSRRHQAFVAECRAVARRQHAGTSQPR